MAGRDKFEAKGYQLEDYVPGAKRAVPRPPTPPRPVGPRPSVTVPELDEVLQRLGKALETHRQPIELLYEACRHARMPMPGLPPVVLAHARTPKGEDIVVYLARKAGAEPPFARSVQVGVFRFYDAEVGARTGAEALEEARIPPAQIPPALVPQLRLKLHHLMHFHVEFKGDPVTRQLFPGPKTVAPPPPMSNAQRLKAKMKFEKVLHQAEALVFGLEREMQVVARVLAQLDRRGGPDFLALTRGREEREACMLAIGLGRDQAAQQRLRDGVRDHKALAAAVAQARKSQDPSGLEAAAFPLSGFRLACAEHPVLKQLFPPQDQEAS